MPSRVPRFDEVTFDEATFAGEDATFVPGGRASYQLIPRCYVSDKNGNLSTDISQYILDGKVSVDADAETPMTFTANTTSPYVLDAFEWIMPWLTIGWFDPQEGEQEITEPVGLYQIMPPGETHTAAQGIGRIEGRDPTWALKQDTLPSGLGFAAGANVVTSIKSVLTAAGFTRVNIPAKSNTFSKKRAYDAGTPRLDVINDLLFRISYYPLWCDRYGIPTSRYVRSLQKEEPARRISSAAGDVVNTVTIDSDYERLCNRCTVTKNDAADAPITVTKQNTRADSPISIPNMDGQVFGKLIEASNIDTLQEATDLALRILEEGASMLTRLAVETVPDPRFDVRDVIHAIISRDDGTLIASGRWWADEVEIGFSPKAGAMRHRLNKLIEFEGS